MLFRSGLSATTLGGNRGQLAQTELLAAAEDHLSTRGYSCRHAAHEELEEVPSIRELAAYKALPAAAVEEIPVNDWAVPTKNDKALASAIAAQSKSLGTLHSQVEGLRKDVSAFVGLVGPRLRDPAVRALQEETQVLWWLFGEWSAQEGRSFDRLDRRAAVPLLAFELAGLLRFEPAHPQTRQILRRALARCGGAADDVLGIADIALPTKLKFSVPTNELITPILCLSKKAAESPGDDAWLARFAVRVGIDASLKLAPETWASMIVNELLLLRRLNDAA